MATINLLPDSVKHLKPFKKEGIKLSLKLPRSFLFAFILIAGLFFIILTSLVFQVHGKERTMAAFNKELLGLKSNYKEIETLDKRKKELNKRVSFYQGVFGNTILWSEKLSLINKAIPAQIWLLSIYTEAKPNRILVIKGFSTSAVESEIIDSISSFVDRLKKEPSFSKDFEEIKLGPLVSEKEKKGNLTVMGFSLVCKFKS